MAKVSSTVKMVKMPAPATKPTAAPAAPAAAAAKPVATAKPKSGPTPPTVESRYKGVTSGLRIGEYQNASLVKANKNKTTDASIASEWNAEFPRAMTFGVAMVRTVRRLFNAGKHKNEAPAKPLVEWDAEGNPAPAPTRGRKPKLSPAPEETSFVLSKKPTKKA